MAEEKKPEDSVAKLGELIKDIKIAMLTTAEADGSLRSRPMGVQQTKFDGDLWFFTGKSSGKVTEIQHNQHVNVSFAEPSDNRFVSVSGRAELIDDRSKAKELWNPFIKAWFPKGLDDPDLMLLKIKVETAEYWDAPSSTMVNLAGFAKAILTGKRPEVGENEKLNL